MLAVTAGVEGELQMNESAVQEPLVGKTIALYQQASNGRYGQLDLTEYYQTCLSEIGEDVQSAGIITEVVTLVNKDYQCFFYGDQEQCIDYLMEEASDQQDEYSVLTLAHSTLVDTCEQDKTLLVNKVEQLQARNEALKVTGQELQVENVRLMNRGQELIAANQKLSDDYSSLFAAYTKLQKGGC